LSCRLLQGDFLCSLPQSNPRAATVLVDEFDTAVSNANSVAASHYLTKGI
jgi:hypothetical protein